MRQLFVEQVERKSDSEWKKNYNKALEDCDTFLTTGNEGLIYIN